LSFACKVAKVRGITRSTASVKVANSTMRVGCKPLIEAVGLYSTRYASHLCTRGGDLSARQIAAEAVRI
jgi:hypothetical protein